MSAVPTHVSADAWNILLSEDDNNIIASCSDAKCNDNNRSPPLDRASLQEIIQQSELAQAWFDDALLDNFVELYNQGQHPLISKIGERRDGQCTIHISADSHKAYLSLSPAFAGQTISRTDIFQAIVAAGISRGVINQCISYALEQGQCKHLLIAKGLAPKPGKDSQFETLLPTIRDRYPRIDNSGRAHYQEIGGLISVSKGEVLLRRLPPSMGQPGFDVFGNVLPASEGNPLPFASNLSGVEVDNSDPDLLRSAINGQPVIVEQGAIVEPTMTLENVDLSTGNIHFDGSLYITGKVSTGMEITASGDVLIDGMVEAAASISAGGDINVKQGIIGRGAISNDDGEIGKGTAQISSEFNISARFIENAWIRAEQSIQVEELIAHSDIKAGHNVVVGSKNSKHGHIRGGSVVAQQGICAQVLGSPANVVTHLHVAETDVLDQKLAQHSQELDHQRGQRREMEARMAKLCIVQSRSPVNTNKDVVDRLNHELHSLNQKINQNQRIYLDLKQQRDHLCQVQIRCLRKAYPNVELHIAGHSVKLDDEKHAGAFTLDGQQIKYNPM